MKPLFSIIIPTFNEESTLPKLLADLSAQSFHKFEVIVVDGKSQDQTPTKAKQWKTSVHSLRIIETQKRNVSLQRNIGAHKAKADWLIFMDADNRLPHHFLRGLQYRIEATHPDILTTWILPDSREPKDMAITTVANLYIEIQKTTDRPSVLESMIICKKRAFDDLGGFNPNIHWNEGGDLLTRAMRKKLRFEVARDPRYTYSLRRLRKNGFLKSARIIAQLELARIRRKNLSKEELMEIYPMQGGRYFETERKPSHLEKIFVKLFRHPHPEDEKPKTGFLKTFIRSLIR